jgi:hypothetical protein
VQLHDYGCALKAYRREIIDRIRLYGEMHRFIPRWRVMPVRVSRRFRCVTMHARAVFPSTA